MQHRQFWPYRNATQAHCSGFNFRRFALVPLGPIKTEPLTLLPATFVALGLSILPLHSTSIYSLFPGLPSLSGGAVLTTLSSQVTDNAHSFNLQGTLVPRIRQVRAASEKYSEFALLPAAQEALEFKGLVITDQPTKSHSHPACKTLENYFLRVVVPASLKTLQGPLTCYWLKAAKAQNLSNDIRSPFTLVNPILTPKDVIRFGPTGSNFQYCNTQTAFFHDAGMFFTPSDLYAFFSNSPSLTNLLATLVLPPELLDGLPPAHPSIYTFSTHGNNFEFFPDGDKDAHYSHSLDQLWWLKTKTIEGPDFTLTLQRLESVYAHHLYFVTRTPLLPPSTTCFDLGDRVMIDPMFLPGFRENYGSISRKVHRLALSYTTSLKTLELYHIKARARQAIGTDKLDTPLSDEFLAAQIANELRSTGLNFVPTFLTVTQPHHLITRLGPIRWLRLTLTFPWRKAWKTFLTEINPNPYSARQELSSVFVGADLTYSSQITGTFSHFTTTDFFTLARHCVFGSRGQTSRLTFFGGSQSTPTLSHPFFSRFTAKLCLTSLGLTLAPKLNYLGLAKSLWTASSFLLRNYQILPFALPALILAGSLAPTVASKSLDKATTFMARLLQRTFNPTMFPSSLRNIYVNLKLANSGFLFGQVNFAAGPSTISPTLVTPTAGLPLPAQKGFSASQAMHRLTSNIDPQALVTGQATLDTVAYEHSDCAQDHPLCFINLGRIKVLPTTETCSSCTHADYMLCPSVPQGTNDCLFEAVSSASGIPLETVWKAYCFENPRGVAHLTNPTFKTELDAHLLACRLRLLLTICPTDGSQTLTCGVADGKKCSISYQPGHYFHKASQTPESLAALGPTMKPTPPPFTKPSRSSKSNKTTLKASARFKGTGFSTGWHDYLTNPKRAALLVKGIKNREFGALLPDRDSLIMKMDSVVDKPLTRVVQLFVIFGLPGSKKTYDLLEFLKAEGYEEDYFRFVSPSVSLRDAAKAALHLPPMEGYKSPTFETPLLGSVAEIIILDEIGKYPPGYTDLLLLMYPSIKAIIMTGDPNQSVFHPVHADPTLHLATPEIDYFSKYLSVYKKVCYRFNTSIANALGLPFVDNGLSGSFNIDSLPSSGSTAFYAAEGDVKTSINLGTPAYTFTGSQGITVDNGIVYIDASAVKADDRAWFTVLTRCRRNLRICNISGEKAYRAVSAICRALVMKRLDLLQKAIAAHINTHTPGSFRSAFSGGLEDLTVDIMNARYQHLSGIIAAHPIDDILEPEVPHPQDAESSFPNPSLPTTSALPKGTFGWKEKLVDYLLQLFGISFIEPRGSAERDRDFKTDRTAQVNDSSPLHQLFLKHSRDDVATTNWTFEKRYPRNRRPDKIGHTALGVHMFGKYLEAFRYTETEFDEELYEQCRAYDEAQFFGKGERSIMNIKARSDPHWDPQYAELFMKAQLITKPGSEDRLAKPGALIFSFSTQTNFDWGALSRYLTLLTEVQNPSHVFSINLKTDADLSAHTASHMKFTSNRKKRESDYEAYDQSMDYWATVVDLLIMRLRNIPLHLRESYDIFTTHVVTMLGPMIPMMATGFKFTFYFNTERSKAYQATKYVLNWGDAYYGSGDDVVHDDPNPKLQPEWNSISGKLLLVAVENFSDYPIFCGWIQTPEGCLKSPVLLLHRTAAKIARSVDFSFVYGYMADCSPLHKNLEIFAPYLTSEQFESHFLTIELLRHCARHTGLAAQGEFLVRYGLTRNYSL